MAAERSDERPADRAGGRGTSSTGGRDAVGPRSHAHLMRDDRSCRVGPAPCLAPDAELAGALSPLHHSLPPALMTRNEEHGRRSAPARLPRHRTAIVHQPPLSHAVIGMAPAALEGPRPAAPWRVQAAWRHDEAGPGLPWQGRSDLAHPEGTTSDRSFHLRPPLLQQHRSMWYRCGNLSLSVRCQRRRA